MSKEPDKVYTIHLELEPYLAQWLVDDNGGTTPVFFRKLSVENRIMETFLTSLPPNTVPDMPSDNTVAIAIPNYKNGDPQTYNYLPRAAKLSLKKVIRDRFLIQLWDSLHRFGHIGKRRDHLIIAYMETHGIVVDDTNYNTIAKIYLRQHRAYLTRLRRKKNSSKKSK